MSKISANNVDFYYQSVGNGSETILFSHGFLMNNTMFNGQIDALKDKFRCISYDLRGHGQSGVPKDGYDLNNLVTDTISLIEGLNVGPVHFVGISASGFVGMRLALRRPDLLKSLILINTSAEEETKAALREAGLLLWVIKRVGWWAVIGKVMSIMFHKSFLKDSSRKAEVTKWRKIMTGHNKNGIIPFARGFYARKNVLDKLAGLSLPTAIFSSDQDLGIAPDYSQRMADIIPNAKLYKIPDSGHFVPIEQPSAVADLMIDFYTGAGIIGA